MASTSLASPTSPSEEPLVVQFHIVATEGLNSPAWPRMKRSLIRHIVRVKLQGSRNITDKTDAARADESTWHENLRLMGPLASTDKFTFRVDSQLISLPLLGRYIQTTIASTQTYSLRSLLALQGKQGHNKDLKLPLTSELRGNEEAFLVLNVRQPSSAEVGAWAATQVMEQHQQRLLKGKSREEDIPTTTGK